MNRETDWAHQRLMSRVMQEIHHIPIPTRPPRYRPLMAAAAAFYVVCLLVMWILQGTVHAVWQWMIATVWVSNVEWLVEHPLGLVEVAAVGACVVISVWIVRTGGQAGG